MHKLILSETSELNKTIDFSSLRNKSVLITGASGLVGLFLLASLKPIHKELNIKIFTWINSPLEEYIKPLFENCTIVKGDICDVNLYMTLPQFDVVIHSAGYGQPAKFLIKKLTTININTSATEKLFNILKPDGSFLFLSSSEIYNGLDISHITEDLMGTTNTDHPRSCYIEGKKCGETICNVFSQHGYNVKIARLCLAYGPGTKKDDKRVINSFIEKGLKNDCIELLDHGDAQRTYCYIVDAIEMLWNILLHSKHTTYNVGGTDVISILKLAQKIGNILNKPIKLPETDHSAEGNPKNVNISCQRYLNEFDKQTFFSLDYGLEKTIEWNKTICI
jgi:nucleoside-diphosphate-sugar epimerase